MQQNLQLGWIQLPIRFTIGQQEELDHLFVQRLWRPIDFGIRFLEEQEANQNNLRRLQLLHCRHWLRHLPQQRIFGRIKQLPIFRQHLIQHLCLFIHKSRHLQRLEQHRGHCFPWQHFLLHCRWCVLRLRSWSKGIRQTLRNRMCYWQQRFVQKTLCWDQTIQGQVCSMRILDGKYNMIEWVIYSKKVSFQSYFCLFEF